MPGLDPGIHSPSSGAACAWIAGSSPAMTVTERNVSVRQARQKEANI
jgi:hypothetical protein